MKSPPTESIDAYIADFPENIQKILKTIRVTIRKAAPKAEEGLKWGMPALSYDRILFMFAGFKKHVSLFPTPAVIKKFSKELSKFKTSAGTIQFPLDKPLPLALIRKIAKFRVQEAVARDAKWM